MSLTLSAAGTGSAANMLPAFVVILAILSLLPFLLTMLTSFAKLVVVGGIVRQAVGTPQIPPTIVITGLSLILTVHIMAPVAITIYRDFDSISTLSKATERSSAECQRRWSVMAADMALRADPDAARVASIGTVQELITDTSPGARAARGLLAEQYRQMDLGASIVRGMLRMSGPRVAPAKAPVNSPAFESLATDANLRALRTAVTGPIEEFLVRHSSRRNTELFEGLISRLLQSQGLKQDAMPVILRKFVVHAPAFVLTELSEAFMIGFLIFVPFLVIDLVVSNVLLALGMQMLTPTMISLPLKLLVFVMMDGWALILRGLVTGYV